ncbi:WAP four-disulfide core domain protein 5 [Panthera onca]
MRAWGLLLLVALLALGSQLPAALARRKGASLKSLGLTCQQLQDSGGSLIEKSGGCPPDDGPCLLSVPDHCVDDSQCPARMKCCYKACFRQCVRKISVKPGSCPEDRLRCVSPVQHLCHQDSDCKGSARCCLGACGRDCRSPARG